MDLAIRAVVLYVFVVVLMRIVGRRELSSLNAVDLVLLIILGDAIQQGLTQDDYSVTGAVIVVSTFAVLQVLSSYISFRSGTARKLLAGSPIVLVEAGEPIMRNLRRERMTLDDLAEDMRLAQIATLSDVQWAILERNGEISFIKKNDSGD
jgi:uncharacterized membrane protein YcaP (DUF421 family)